MKSPAPAPSSQASRPVDSNVRGLLVWVACAGAATMTVELAAVRLIAPWFGTSSGVWTNVIGVILLALAIGYALGARAAARAPLRRSIALALGTSCLFTASLPWTAPFVCGWFLPDGIGLEASGTLFLWGSLAATFVLFLLPAVALGAVGPLAVELCSRSGLSPGAAGGRVLCASTLGSLAGTFGTTHFALPHLGVARTMLLAALLLAFGAAALWPGRRAVAGLALIGAVGLSLAAGGGVRRAPALPAGVELLQALESSYQSSRAVVDRRGDVELRLLQVNEGLDSFQSAWRAQIGPIGEGFYYDAFALPAWYSGRSAGTWRVGVLGLGAGTAFRVIEGASPPGLHLEMVGAEIDPAVIELGERWFDLPRDAASRRVQSGWDARAALRGWPAGFDQLVLDAYAHQTEIPAHLCSREAMGEMRGKLADGGWLSINVGGFSFDDPLVRAVAATASDAFESPVLVLRIGGSRNFVILARHGLACIEPASIDVDALPKSLAHVFGPAQLASGHRWMGADAGVVLTDDLNPVDELQRRSILEADLAARRRG